MKENLISEFSDPHILNATLMLKVMNERGEVQKGEGCGVSHDIIAEFWNLFFISAAVGASEKVPKWRMGGNCKNTCLWYTREGYIPIQLSSAFLSLCLFGESNINKSFLIESFKAYLLMGEQKIVNDVLSGKLNPDDDDVVEFLSGSLPKSGPFIFTSENQFL